MAAGWAVVAYANNTLKIIINFVAELLQTARTNAEQCYTAESPKLPISILISKYLILTYVHC